MRVPSIYLDATICALLDIMRYVKQYTYLGVLPVWLRVTVMGDECRVRVTRDRLAAAGRVPAQIYTTIGAMRSRKVCREILISHNNDAVGSKSRLLVVG